MIHEPLLAQTRQTVLPNSVDPRGEAELTVCNQNLENYGLFQDVRVRVPTTKPDDIVRKGELLAQRIVRAGCDIIAVQELIGSKESAEEALAVLGEQIRQRIGRIFEGVVGPSNNKNIRNGFLYATDRVSVENRVSYAELVLPKLTEKQRQRYFARGPLEVQFRIFPQTDAPSKVITMVAFHFKSKSGGGGDPSGLDYEPWRMEMAEAMRQAVLKRHGKSVQYGGDIVILLGDRNSDFDSASARILEGVLPLSAFQGEAPCRLSKRGVPLCKEGLSGPQTFFSVLTEDPQTKMVAGTYMYGKTYHWLDDILLGHATLPFGWQTPSSRGDYNSGVLYEPLQASDHALVWLTLNW